MLPTNPAGDLAQLARALPRQTLAHTQTVIASLLGKGPGKTGTSKVPLFKTKHLHTEGESFKDEVNGQIDEYLSLFNLTNLN